MATFFSIQPPESESMDDCVPRSIPRYKYGAPLPVIPECSETGGICQLPFETITQVYLELVQRNSDPKTDAIAFKKAAFDLLNVSHSCSYLRAVALSSPYLWSLVPFIGGISPQFLDAILARSQPFDVTLSFFERSAWPIDHRIWNRVSNHRHRIQSLRAQVAEDCDGRWLRALLNMADGLEDLSVRFHGNRDAPLIHRSSGQLSGLRSIYLVNCFLPTCCGPFPLLDHYHVERSRSAHTQGARSALSMRSFFRWREDFEYLSSLTLHNAVSPFHRRDSHPLEPVELPHLELLDVAGCLATCKQLGSMLEVPSSCVRRVAIVFLACCETTTIKHTRAAAGAAALFVEPDATYEAISISLTGGDLCVRLSVHDESDDWDTTLEFKTSGLRFPNPTGPLNFILALLSLPTHEVFTLSSWDGFLLRLCDHLALALKPSLLFADHLILDLDHSPSLSSIIQPFLSVMKEMSKVTIATSRTWRDPCFPVILDHYFCQFKEVVVVLDLHLDDFWVQNLQDFIARQDGIKFVEFGVTPQMVARLGPSDERITSQVRAITKGLPRRVGVYWYIWDTGLRV